MFRAMRTNELLCELVDEVSDKYGVDAEDLMDSYLAMQEEYAKKDLIDIAESLKGGL